MMSKMIDKSRLEKLSDVRPRDHRYCPVWQTIDRSRMFLRLMDHPYGVHRPIRSRNLDSDFACSVNIISTHNACRIS